MLLVCIVCARLSLSAFSFCSIFVSLTACCEHWRGLKNNMSAHSAVNYLSYATTSHHRSIQFDFLSRQWISTGVSDCSGLLKFIAHKWWLSSFICCTKQLWTRRNVSDYMDGDDNRESDFFALKYLISTGALSNWSHRPKTSGSFCRRWNRQNEFIDRVKAFLVNRRCRQKYFKTFSRTALTTLAHTHTLYIPPPWIKWPIDNKSYRLMQS